MPSPAGIGDSLDAMFWKPYKNIFVVAVAIGVILICCLSICAQTPSTQSIPIRSEQELALALLKAQTERPADVPGLLKDNAQFLSEAFWQEILDAAALRYSQNQQDRAFLLYAIAKQIAVELKNQKLLAKTYYY